MTIQEKFPEGQTAWIESPSGIQRTVWIVTISPCGRYVSYSFSHNSKNIKQTTTDKLLSREEVEKIHTDRHMSAKERSRSWKRSLKQ